MSLDNIKMKLNQLEKYYLELLGKHKRGEISKKQFKETRDLLLEIEAKINQKSQDPKPKIEKKFPIPKNQNKINKQKERNQRKQQQLEAKREKEKQERQKREEERKIKLEKIAYWKKIAQDEKEIIKRQHQFINQISKLDYYQRIQVLDQQTPIKEFEAEHHYSKKVVLLENFIVKKYCSSFFTCQNEVNSLRKLTQATSIPELSQYSHFPKLVAYDFNRQVVYMTYCGQMLNKKNLPKDWREQFERIRKILALANVNSNDMLVRNTCVLDNQLQIIDFGLDTIFGRSLQETTTNFYKRLVELEGSRHIPDRIPKRKEPKIKIGK